MRRSPEVSNLAETFRLAHTPTPPSPASTHTTTIAAPAVSDLARAVEAKITDGRAEEITEAEANQLYQTDQVSFYRLAERLDQTNAIRVFATKRPWEARVPNLHLYLLRAFFWEPIHGEPAFSWSNCSRQVLATKYSTGARLHDRLVYGYGKALLLADINIHNELAQLDFLVWRLGPLETIKADYQRALEFRTRERGFDPYDRYEEKDWKIVAGPQHYTNAMVSGLAAMLEGYCYYEGYCGYKSAHYPDVFQPLLELTWRRMSSHAKEAIVAHMTLHPDSAARYEKLTKWIDSKQDRMRHRTAAMDTYLSVRRGMGPGVTNLIGQFTTASITPRTPLQIHPAHRDRMVRQVSDQASLLQHLSERIAAGTVDDVLVQATRGVKRQLDTLVEELSEQVAKKPKRIAAAAASVSSDSD